MMIGRRIHLMGKKRRKWKRYLLFCTFLLAGILAAGCGKNGGSGTGSGEVKEPGAYPLPKGQEDSKNLGVFDYDMTYYVSLTAEEGADVYYEVAEGENAAKEPTTGSTKFDPYQYRQIPIEQPEASADGPVTKTYNIKAIALIDGKSSKSTNWNYTVTSNPHHHLKVGDAKDSDGKAVPGVTLIQDYDSDKMYFVKGSDRAMVIDAGYFDPDDAADLYSEARKLAGSDDLPIDLVIGHPHPDHVQMAYQFLCDENKQLGGKIYVNERGIDTLRSYITNYGTASGMFADEKAADSAYEEQLALMSNGDAIDLGGAEYHVVELPGHQDAGVMLYNPDNGYLFTSDEVGNNRAHLTDSFWMQFGYMSDTLFADPMDVYQSSYAVAMERVRSLGGEIKYVLTGHNDVVLKGETYLTNLEQAVQNVVDQGEDSMTPSLRTMDSIEGFKENTRTVVVGDRLTDVDWAGINVNLQNYLSDGYRDGKQNTIADLCNLSVHEKGKTGNLLWEDPNFGINVNWQYPSDGTKPTKKQNLTFTAKVDAGTDSVVLVPTASASAASVTVDGKKAESGKEMELSLKDDETKVPVEVTAPDGTTKKMYTVVIKKVDSSKAEAPYTYTDYSSYTDPFYADQPGTYTVTQYMALFCDTEGAEIHYTVDGSDPKTSDTAKIFDQKKYGAQSGVGGKEVPELITIGQDTGGDWDGKAKQTKVSLKAYASKEGLQDSDVVTFDYTIDRMDKTAHKNRLLYDEDGMKVYQVIDYDSDKMYLICGSKSALLIDAGMAPENAENLYDYCRTLAGTDEVDLFISHGHPDHTTQIGDFVKAGRKVYMNKNDLEMAKKFINDKTVSDSDFTFIEEGQQFNLGGVTLDAYFLPGHTPGSMVLLDKAHNILYSSDGLGCNRRSVADSLTLASNDCRVLLSSLEVFTDKMKALDAAGEIDLDAVETWTGHDDYPICDLPGHLRTVKEAAQNIVDYGPSTAMRDSVRNTADSNGASFAGDRYAFGGTGHFICMNGKKETALGGQDAATVSELANLKVTADQSAENLMQNFSSVHQFGENNTVGAAYELTAAVPSGTKQVTISPTAMASKGSVQVNGQPLENGSAAVDLSGENQTVEITVTAPNGTDSKSYTLNLVVK